ncbi:transposase [Pseudoramibacter alactolyticus]|uniref:transposase n=1 Tax=Pseudoramibacter alactolyticus TaxID=113287 RepID=UPI0036F3AFEA
MRGDYEWVEKRWQNRKWINEERLRYVLMCEEESYPVKTLARERGIPFGTLNGWVRKYRNGGVNALNPEKLHPGKTNL